MLEATDQALIDAYVRTATPLRELPYAPEFETLLAYLGEPAASETRCRQLWQRLLALEKAGQLPHIGPHGVVY